MGFLKGKFHYCDTRNVPDYAVAEIMTKWDCIDYGGEWQNYEGNFDNVIAAMTTLFGMMSTEGWVHVMWNAVDATEVHQVPRRDNSPGFVGFFILFMIIGSLFILNLFVGVVINTFNVEKEKLSNNNKMTDLQKEYVEVMIKCYSAKPLKIKKKQGNKIRSACMKFQSHNCFEIFIFVCICLNTIVLALVWYGISEKVVETLEILNYAFTTIYTLEAIIKIVALGRDYFKDSWCIFDFSIVITAWLAIVLEQFFTFDLGPISTIFRAFRIARVLRLIKSAKNLHQIFQTFILASREMLNVGALLILFLFIFSILGVTIFAEVKLQETMNRHANFENFGRAILTLFRVATGEGWVEIMYDAARQPSIDFSCI